MRRLFSPLAVNVQVSDEYVTIGLSSFNVFSFWCFSIEVSILLVLHWHNKEKCIHEIILLAT